MPLELRAVHYAKQWDRLPSEWRALSVDDRGQMMACVQYEATLESYRDEWQDGKKDRAKSSASNDFLAMKKRLKLREE